MGYDYIVYFMSECSRFSYYKDRNKHVYTVHGNQYKAMKATEGLWYWRYSKSGELLASLLEYFEKANIITPTISSILCSDDYFCYSQLEPLIVQAQSIDNILKTIDDATFRKYIVKKYGKQKIGELFNGQTYSVQLGVIREQYNNEYVAEELERQKAFFDTCQKYPLDAQQRESIVKQEDNCLVISSAGSGKTSTSIAKVKYLLEKKKYKESDILIMSYNRKTAEEFAERLGVPGVSCKTFHALALQIIGQAEGRRPDVADDSLLRQCYYQLISEDETFKKAINEYIAHISSLTKTEHEYIKAEDYFLDRETYGIMAPYGDMNGSPIYTRSEEERRICTWLSEHGVTFCYEEMYPIDTYSIYHRQYKPDFTIHVTRNGRDERIFLEHFGIDKDGDVPQWFADNPADYMNVNRRYNDDIRWKRSLHSRMGTTLLETRSAMFHDRTVFIQLESQLLRAGVPIRLLSEEEKFQKLIQRNKAAEDSINNLFSSFISLMKSNGKTFDSIMKAIEDSEQPEAFVERCRFLMYQVIKPLYDKYERTLREKGQEDFTDLILHASELSNSGKYKTPYRYIIVDEFQDISTDRYKLILSLRRKNGLTKTYCVGDDWQSIYRFSGSDINLFSHFEKYFGFTEKCKIETTYRFGNPLVKMSSDFILKNPNQMEKSVRPYSETAVTNMSFVAFDRQNNNYLKKIKEVVEGIPANESVMLLGRYNHEKQVFPQQCISNGIGNRRAVISYAGRTMPFMSVHAAKGLEADHVILLNCSQDGGGFPSRVADDPILGYVLSEIDTYEYSEERRLFYVAITRAKKHIHILYNEKMPSVFVTEILYNGKTDMMLCPRCKRGRLSMIRDAVSTRGDRYRNYVCSNNVGGCNFFWQVYFKNDEEIKNKYNQQFNSEKKYTWTKPLPDVRR